MALSVQYGFRKLVAVFALVALTAGLAAAGPDDTDAPEELEATRVSGSISIDGVLDESDWNQARSVNSFRQSQPNEGDDPTFPSEVSIVYGESSVFIGATLSDPEPDKIDATLGRRDFENQADWFEVSIDSYFDQKTAFVFAVNAAGIQMDGLFRDGSSSFRRFRMDTSWDAIWESNVRITPEGWIVEMRIPYSMLRFSDSAEQTWGVNFRRTISRLGEIDSWPLIPSNAGSTMPFFGHVTGLIDLKPRRNLQVSPYTLAQVNTFEAEEGGLASSRAFDAGADFKVGISSAFTLDATVNPDFGQVEADPAELNLTTFETFFQEKRPFFLEGNQIFDFSLGGGRDGGLLYTRRIGSAASPIIGAAKLSGQTEGGLSIGVMGATTGAQFSPDQGFGVIRAKQLIGNSFIGAMLTGMDRRESADFSSRQSFTGGLDFDFRFGDNSYKLDGFAAATQVDDPRDADYVSTSGYAGELSVDKIRGSTTYGAGFRLYSPDFNPNYTGRLRENNLFRVSGFGNRNWNDNRPFGAFNRAGTRLFLWHSWSYDDFLNQGSGFWFRNDFTFRNFHGIEASVFAREVGGYDIRETRGLWAYAQPTVANVNIEYETDSRKQWVIATDATYSIRSEESVQWEAAIEGDWNVSDRLSLSAELGFGFEDNVDAWASNTGFIDQGGSWLAGPNSVEPADILPDDDQLIFDDKGELANIIAGVDPAGDPGSYYLPVFGDRDTRQVDFTLRGSWTFTPNLSLQMFGQLFVAKGGYENFRVLSNPDELRSFGSYPKNHDFNVTSLLSNVVLRWEYQPGSIFYVVWSQNRSGGEYQEIFGFDQDSPFTRGTTDLVRDTFNIFPENALLVKFNYTFLR